MGNIEQEAQEMLQDEELSQYIADFACNPDDMLYAQIVRDFELDEEGEQAFDLAVQMYTQNPDLYGGLQGDALELAGDEDAYDLSEGVVGSVVGGIAGSSVGGPVGSAIGSELGDIAQDKIEDYMSDDEENIDEEFDMPDLDTSDSNSGSDISLTEGQLRRVVFNVAKRLMREGSMENIKDGGYRIEDHKIATMKRVGTKKDSSPKMGSKKKCKSLKSIIKKQTQPAIEKSRQEKEQDSLAESLHRMKRLMIL